MQTWKHHPEELADYIEAYWFLRVDESDTTAHFPRLLPTAYAHYIATPSVQPYHYQHKEKIISGYGSHLLGPSTQTITLNESTPLRRLGIKFKPGALYALFNIEGADILNTCAPFSALEKVLPYEQANVALAHDDSYESIINLLDNVFLQLTENIQLDSYFLLAKKVAQLIEHRIELQEWEKLGSQQIAMELNCSKRTLERAFSRITGVTIKQYQTMQQLETLFVFLSDQQVIDWASIAEHFNFSDQAHMIRQLKNTLGKTPTEYAEVKDLVIDVYGKFE